MCEMPMLSVLQSIRCPQWSPRISGEKTTQTPQNMLGGTN